MAFAIPLTVPMTYKTADGVEKQYADSTIKMYKQRLNWLARNGYNTPDSLIRYVYNIVPLIETEDRTMKALHKRRNIISAIFWVLPESYSKTPNPYQELFHRSFHNMATDYVK